MFGRMPECMYVNFSGTDGPFDETKIKEIVERSTELWQAGKNIYKSWYTGSPVPGIMSLL